MPPVSAKPRLARPHDAAAAEGKRASPLSARLAGVHRPDRRAGVQHRRHGDDGAGFCPRPGGAGDRRLDLHLGLRRPDGRDFAAGRSPASCSARQTPESGHEAEQAVWLALALSVVGCAVCSGPSPFSPGPGRAGGRGEGARLSPGLAAPAAALVFMAYRAFNVAVSRPKAVMVRSSAAWRSRCRSTPCWCSASRCRRRRHARPSGARRGGLRHRHRDRHVVPAAGGDLVVRRDTFYAPFGLGYGLARPSRRSLAALLRLGVPMGCRPDRGERLHLHGLLHLAIGATPVAGHQSRSTWCRSCSCCRWRSPTPRACWWRSASAPATSRMRAASLGRPRDRRADRSRARQRVYLLRGR